MECLDDETAALLISRELAPEEREAVLAHVDTCESCFDLVASLAETITPSPDDAPPDEAPSASPMWKRGACVGRYVLLEKIGAGGMGAVFSAEDPALARTVAVKLVHASLRTERANNGLLVEARMMAQLSHPNVVPVFDVGQQDDLVFLAMELVDGDNLREWLAQKRPLRDVKRVFLAAGEGLAAAHRVGLVHRDFKPDNVLVSRDGRVLVTDFGLAHSTLEPDERVAGTLPYMAPEQREGGVVDARSDQYAFAVALSEALTGERPKSNVRDPRLPAWLGRIVAKGMAAKPEERFASMSELLSALARDPARSRRSRMTGVLVVVGVVGAAVLGARLSRPNARACADAVPAKLAGAWDAERRDAIHRAFVATASPNAATSERSVSEVLDTYASSWRAMYVDACDAMLVRKEQSNELFDLRVACLGERRAELEAATKLFASADARVVAIAPNAARALTPVESCADTRALLAVRPPPPAVAARVAELRRELARAKALRDGGRLDDAIALGRRLAPEATDIAYEPVLAAVLFQLGDAELASGDGEIAEATLARAALAADAARDDVLRARALTRQLYATGYALERFEAAGRLEAQLASVLARVGQDDELEADRLQTLGMIAFAKHDFVGADDRLSRAVALREKRFGPRGRRVAMSRHGRCLVRIEQGRIDDARPDCSSALEIWREQLGPDHPDFSLGLRAMGELELREGRVDDASRDYTQALAIEEAVFPPDHPTLAVTLLGLAECRAAGGDAAAALVLEQRALAIREAKLGPKHPRTGEALSRVAARYQSLGDTATARVYEERARVVAGSSDAAKP